MHLWYYRDTPNVGDWLNDWLWPKVFGETMFDESPEERFLGIGSILDDRHSPVPRKLVFGSGARRAGSIPDISDGTWDIRFVRGPGTARAMGGVPYISDPAILAPLYLTDGGEIPGPATHPGVTGFVPYFLTDRATVEQVCEAFDMVPIYPDLEPGAFMSALKTCKAVVAEAMHGAILADAFRVPWTGVRLQSVRYEGRTSQFKWNDWLQSLGIPTSAVAPGALLDRPRIRKLLMLEADAPISLSLASRRLERVLARGQWTLSADERLQRAQEQILEQCHKLGAERVSNWAP